MEILNNKEFLSYTDEDVIYRFLNIYDIDENEAEDIFMEMKKFIALAYYQPGIFINNDILILDEMWHNFILFTKKYQAFCEHFFGKIIHHIPSSKKESEEHQKLLEENPERAKEEFLEREEKLLNSVYDFLGEDTVIKWFQHYPNKYTKDYIKSIMK